MSEEHYAAVAAEGSKFQETEEEEDRGGGEDKQEEKSEEGGDEEKRECSDTVITFKDDINAKNENLMASLVVLFETCRDPQVRHAARFYPSGGLNHDQTVDLHGNFNT